MAGFHECYRFVTPGECIASGEDLGTQKKLVFQSDDGICCDSIGAFHRDTTCELQYGPTFDGANQLLSYPGTSDSKSNDSHVTSSLVDRDRIGCGLDFVTRKVFFTKNGIFLGE